MGIALASPPTSGENAHDGRQPMVQMWVQWAAQTQTILRRLPKNLRSNRWWIVWNERLYISQPAAARIPGRSEDASLLAGNLAYVHWSQLLRNPALIGAERRALFLPELGMFGNMTRRLAAALTITDALKLGHVVVPESAKFEGSIFETGGHPVSSGATFWLFSGQEAAHAPVLVLHKKELFGAQGITRELHAPHIDRAWAALHAITIPKPTVPAFPSDHLVIHLRGGDVFGPRKPASYGQPPLSYYTLILDSSDWAGVTIVHGDWENPVLGPLIRACEVRGTPAHLQTGLLTADLEVLLTGSTLVAGRGTFMPAVVGLSRHVSRVYFFHDKFSVVPPVEGIDMIRVGDADGTYVRELLSNNWENSDHQRNLMLTYPQGNLEFSTVE